FDRTSGPLSLLVNCAKVPRKALCAHVKPAACASLYRGPLTYDSSADPHSPRADLSVPEPEPEFSIARSAALSEMGLLPAPGKWL
ncbi:hypothetical protein GWI33_015962, partial [Rhynchophorus ferrugineus]